MYNFFFSKGRALRVLLIALRFAYRKRVMIAVSFSRGVNL